MTVLELINLLEAQPDTAEVAFEVGQMEWVEALGREAVYVTVYADDEVALTVEADAL